MTVKPTFPSAMDNVVSLGGFGSSLTNPDDKSPARNPALIYLVTLSQGQSRAKMERTLTNAARFFGYADIASCPWERMRYENVVALKAALEQKRLAPTSINVVLCALRGVAREAWKLGLMNDHAERTIAAVKGARGSRETRGRALTRTEVSTVIRGCSEAAGPAGIRDAALFSLGAGCGLRRNELAGVQCEDIDEADGSIRILGKGNKERTVFPPPLAWELVKRWKKERGSEGCGALFVAVQKGGSIERQWPLTADAVYKILDRRAKEFGLTEFSPHDLRRTFATRLLEMGADLNTVREAMGHSSVVTTQRYDHRSRDRIRGLAAQLKL